MTKAEYMKWYWSKPENAERRKRAGREGQRRRAHEKGASAKRMMVSRAKSRAAKRGIPFDLKPTDFEIPDICPVLQIPINCNVGNGGGANSPSLDRIIPERGYVSGNVVVISKRANSIKTDASWEEIQMVANWLREATSRIENPGE